MRALLIAGRTPFGIDGRARRQAAALVEAGWAVTVISRRDPANHDVPGVRVRAYRPPAEGHERLGYLREHVYALLRTLILVVRVYAGRGFDVVQMCGTPSVFVALAGLFRLLGKAIVYDWRDPTGEPAAALASLWSAQHVLVGNEILRDVALARVSRPRVTVVGNGSRVDQLHSRPVDPGLRRGREQLVCLVGMLHSDSGADLAVRAIGHLVHELGRTDTTFALVGTGELVPELKRLTRELELERWVCFPGWVDEERAQTYISTSDLGLEPGLRHFVSPAKVLEYMALGLPFVAFAVAETRLLAGPAAAYAPFEDVQAYARVIDDLLADPERRQRMAEQGRQRVRLAPSWEQEKQAYVALLHRLAIGQVLADSLPDDQTSGAPTSPTTSPTASPWGAHRPAHQPSRRSGRRRPTLRAHRPVTAATYAAEPADDESKE